MNDKELADIHSAGTTEKGKVTVTMQSEHYAIFHWPGGYWSDIGGRHYGQSCYCLALKGTRRFGSSSHVLREWHGRVSKKLLAAALKEAEEKHQVE